MRYGQSMYFQTAQAAQAEAFANEVASAALMEMKRTEALNARLAAATAKGGRLIYAKPMGNA